MTEPRTVDGRIAAALAVAEADQRLRRHYDVEPDDDLCPTWPAWEEEWKALRRAKQAAQAEFDRVTGGGNG